MSWRIVYITDANKLSLNLNSLQVIQEEQKYFVNLNEIAALVVEDYTSVITTRLLIELSEKGIPLVVLGMNKLPIGEMLPLLANSRTSKKILEQSKWSNDIKNKLWMKIIEGKIQNQIRTLQILGKDAKIELLIENISKMQLGDKTNMEGISARIYFKELFGNEFVRFEEDIINKCLDFSYHLVRTIISKEIVARGYNTSIGINHKSQYNVFNFSDDIIEVFRPIVDYHVFNILSSDMNFLKKEMSKELKIELIDIVNKKVVFEGRKYSIINVVPYYISEIIKVLENCKSEFNYPRIAVESDEHI